MTKVAGHIRTQRLVMDVLGPGISRRSLPVVFCIESVTLLVDLVVRIVHLIVKPVDYSSELLLRKREYRLIDDAV